MFINYSKRWEFSVPLDTDALRAGNQLRLGNGEGSIVEQFQTLLKDAGAPRGDAFVVDAAVPNDLDVLIASWRGIKVEGNQVMWTAPENVPPAIVAHLQASLEQLNAFLRSGKLVIADDGTIRPAGEA
jgi:hypothetical protein